MANNKETSHARRARLTHEKEWLIEELQNRNFLLALEVGRLATSSEEAILSLLGSNHRLWGAVEGLASDLMYTWHKGTVCYGRRYDLSGGLVDMRPGLESTGVRYHND